MIMEYDIDKLISVLSEHDLEVHLLSSSDAYRSEIYANYRMFTENEVCSVTLPTDKWYVMNNNGDIIFIGNDATLNNYLYKLERT